MNFSKNLTKKSYFQFTREYILKYQVLEGLGIHVMVDVPEDVAAHLEAVRSKGQP